MDCHVASLLAVTVWLSLRLPRFARSDRSVAIHGLMDCCVALLLAVTRNGLTAVTKNRVIAMTGSELLAVTGNGVIARNEAIHHLLDFLQWALHICRSAASKSRVYWSMSHPGRP